MPHFLDLLIKEVEVKAEQIRRLLEEPEERLTLYDELFKRRWNPLPKPGSLSQAVYAIDSSNGEVELRGGGVILITRALAISNRQEEVRKLTLDALYPRSVRDYTEYKRLIREHLEHLVTLDVIERLGKGDYILIDGSIYGRMLHLIQELDLPGKETFILEYISTYSNLLEKVLNKGIMLIGVSKDSRSTLLREELLREKLEELIQNLDDEVVEKIRSLWFTLRRSPRQVLDEVTKLVEKGVVGEKVSFIFGERLSLTPDSKLITLLNLGVGFSTPLKVTITEASVGEIEAILRSQGAPLSALIRALFPKSVRAYGEEFIEKANLILRRMRSYPPVLVTYAIFGRRDLPLRIDILSKETNSIKVKGPLRFIKERTEIVIEALKVLQVFYAGPRHYNVLLEMADNKVKMRSKSIEHYRRIIEKKLNSLIEHSRGARRVFYP